MGSTGGVGSGWRGILLAAALAACGTPYAVRHRVEPGETLSRVAARYGVAEAELRRFNRLGPEDKVRPGDVVFVPGESRGAASPIEPPGPRPAEPARSPPAQARPAPRPKAPPSSPAPAKPRAPAGWPVAGKIVREFAPERGSRGVDLAVPEGTPVRAVRSGEVAYAGTPSPAYGGLVVLRHLDGLYTVYGNLASVGVDRGERVEKGEVVGTSGPGRRGLGPHVHFEVRRGEEPVDPRSVFSGS
ncbi:peptidoglycan DD-metalloendopeptidase family protein [Deferrisoma sp.]